MAKEHNTENNADRFVSNDERLDRKSGFVKISKDRTLDNKFVFLDDRSLGDISPKETDNISNVIYTKDNYPRLLRDLNKLVDKFVEYEPIDNCYLDLDFLGHKGLLKLCYTNISNSFREYAKDNNIILEKIDEDTFEYDEHFYLTIYIHYKLNNLSDFVKYFSELKNTFNCVDYVTLSNVYDLADVDCIKLLIVLKNAVSLADELNITGFGSKYAFMADVVVEEGEL